MSSDRLFSRAIIRVAPTEEGEDVAGFLQGLVTNDVSGRLPVWAALLTAQGKVLFDFIVWPGAHDSLLIDCEADAADDLIKRLNLYRLRRKIAIGRDDSLGVYWQSEPAGDGGAPDPRLAALGQRWIGKSTPEDRPADDAWTTHRLHVGVAEGRADLGEGETLWLECNAVELHGVSFSKGCYVGQENTARMNWRQKVNRRLVVVPMDRSDPKRRRCEYPTLGLAVDHLRVEDIEPALAPPWMALAEG